METLRSKPNHQEVEDRLRALYTRAAGDRIFATMAVPSPAVEHFAQAYPHGACPCPDVATANRIMEKVRAYRA